MDTENHDKVFFRTFGMVMGGLFAFFFICIVAARINGASDYSGDPVRTHLVSERLAPVARVITDPAALIPVSMPARAALTGPQVVQKVCTACHGTGVLNAPKVGDKAEWNKRKAAVGGVDGLVKSAIAGMGAAMPARGGDASLSDDEVKAAVTQMLADTGT